MRYFALATLLIAALIGIPIVVLNIDWRIVVGTFLAAGAAWMAFEAFRSPVAYETDKGYGPVAFEHSGDTDEWYVPDWEDVSTVRHGGLGR